MAILIFSGKSKSGSPRPRLIASGFATSNIFLICDNSIDSTLFAGFNILSPYNNSNNEVIILKINNFKEN